MKAICPNCGLSGTSQYECNRGGYRFEGCHNCGLPKSLWRKLRIGQRCGVFARYIKRVCGTGSHFKCEAQCALGERVRHDEEIWGRCIQRRQALVAKP